MHNLRMGRTVKQLRAAPRPYRQRVIIKSLLSSSSLLPYFVRLRAAREITGRPGHSQSTISDSNRRVACNQVPDRRISHREARKSGCEVKKRFVPALGGRARQANSKRTGGAERARIPGRRNRRPCNRTET